MKLTIPAVPANIATASSGRKKLPIRGPYKVELDFIVDGMDSSGAFDLSDPDTKETFELMQDLKLGLKMVEYNGPAAFNPLVEIHGKKPAIRKFLELVYFLGMDRDEIKDILDSIEKV